ncbi:MAG: flagellar hook protein FlgE [Armatimonadota bacterium]|nr:flagellar hook protein FlgE [Armatimonadota bacterium]
MNRALFAGLSGTIAFQERMDVVGNNIANANTVAYKEGRTAFADALYETIEGGRSGGEAGIGGSNPVQIGSGVSLGAVSVQHAQGSLERTGQPLDCAVEGEGMFVFTDGQGRYFSRDGSFTLDNTNTLVSSSSGYAVVGWEAVNGQVEASGDPARLSFDISALAAPIASSETTVIGNLDSTAAEGDALSTTISVYDSLGEAHELELTFTKTANVGEWDCEATCEATTATTTMQFDSSGALTAGGTLTIDVALTNGAASPQTVTVELSDVTCLAQAHTVAAQSQNGSPPASLVSIEMSDNGYVMGHYSDGRSKTLGQVAMAGFTNPGGLRRVGNNLFIEGPASGRASIGAAGTGGRGGIVAGSLEMSNVDLTRAFVDMITTQRGFQASTRVIATANEMMDEVVRLIRT